MSEHKRAHRVLIRKPCLDGHDRGSKFIARAMRDAGFESARSCRRFLAGTQGDSI